MTTLHTAEQVSEMGLLPLAPRTLKDYARAGRIGFTRVGRKYCFTPQHIEDFIKASTHPQGSKAKPERDPKYAGK